MCGSCGGRSVVGVAGGGEADIVGLEGALEHGDGVVLGGDIAEVFWAAGGGLEVVEGCGGQVLTISQPREPGVRRLCVWMGRRLFRQQQRRFCGP